MVDYIKKWRSVSPQREWQIRQADAGLCMKCNAPRFKTSLLCEKHLIQNRENNRNKRGYKAKVKGGVGRNIIK